MHDPKLIVNEILLKEILRTIPMGRIAETGDLVGAVLFCHEASLIYNRGGYCSGWGIDGLIAFCRENWP